MLRLLVCLFIAALPASATPVSLYLLNGTTVRGEIVDRSAKSLQVKTKSGVIQVKTAALMPISRTQLKLPAEVEKNDSPTPETEALLVQMEKLVAENEQLKQQIVTLKTALAQSQKTPIPSPAPPDSKAKP